MNRLALWLFVALVALLRWLGPERASNLGGAVARTLGPLLPISHVARGNLSRAWPELDAPARARILRAVWDNLGRTIAELPHVAALGPTASGPGYRLAIHPKAQSLLDAGQSLICITGHFANWEMLVRASHDLLPRFGLFYRAPRNRAADQLTRALRAEAGGPGLEQFAKGAAGARAALRYLRSGGTLGILADQKLNDGIAVPFFGRPAMTSPAAASLALKFNRPILPVRVCRLGPARFEIQLAAPLALPPPGNVPDPHAAIAALTARINDQLEAWVRDRPGEWLWLHRRWPRS